MGATRAAAFAAALLLALWACAPGEPESGPTAPTASGLTLAWNPPTTDADGGPLEDLAGYRIYVASESPVNPETAEVVEVGDATRHTLTGLEPGVYFLAVAAVDTAGNRSELSEEVRAEVEAP